MSLEAALKETTAALNRNSDLLEKALGAGVAVTGGKPATAGKADAKADAKSEAKVKGKMGEGPEFEAMKAVALELKTAKGAEAVNSVTQEVAGVLSISKADPKHFEALKAAYKAAMEAPAGDDDEI